MNIDAETGKKIQELQILEQKLQNLLMQKQSIQLEMAEITNALDALKDSGDEVYKVVGGIMLKAEKSSLQRELEEKKHVFDLRISSMEKEEKSLEEKLEKLRKEVSEIITKKK